MMVKNFPTLIDCITDAFYEEFGIKPKKLKFPEDYELIYQESFTNRNLKTDKIEMSLKDLDGVHIELIMEQPPQEITINFNEN